MSKLLDGKIEEMSLEQLEKLYAKLYRLQTGAEILSRDLIAFSSRCEKMKGIVLKRLDEKRDNAQLEKYDSDQNIPDSVFKRLMD